MFKDKKLYEAALLARDYGIHRNVFRDENNEISPACDIATPGFGGTMSEMNSYIGCLQMDDLPLLLAKQKANAEIWNQELDLFKLNCRSEIEPNYWVYGVLSDNKIKDMLKFRENGYYASGVHLPNSFYSVFGKQSHHSGVLEFNEKFIALPCGWWFEK